MDIKAKISDAVTELKHDKFTSTRLICLVAFVAGLIWLTKATLTEHNVDWIGWMFVTYMVTNTITKSLVYCGNIWLKTITIKTLAKDGVLDESDKAAIAGTKVE